MEMKFGVSDWVHGKTGEGEMVYGFVEAVDGVKDIVTLYVIQSDNDERIGRTTAVRASTVKKVPDADLKDSRHMADLIDLALATWDQAWFMELTEGLVAGERTAVRTEGGKALLDAPNNRLGQYLG